MRHGRGAHLAEEFGTAVLSDLRGRILQQCIRYPDGGVETAISAPADAAAAWAGPTIPTAVAVPTGERADSAGMLVRHSSLD
ncbi:hypothetical protein [Amycolatopsis vastitatis]|uniref:Uncharacterized protein n=1 Tax=Amycolatopsis vastitatis TaxID=1905142 RepID=A0A229SKZ2_9PSEU|nr:hypothetical protein [Amycolatopsis vastitatis]OXM59506.1 hypothetical protein CF165_47320 [Amycolatopsis vastitatis]